VYRVVIGDRLVDVDVGAPLDGQFVENDDGSRRVLYPPDRPGERFPAILREDEQDRTRVRGVVCLGSGSSGGRPTPGEVVRVV
jgi:hypothetical protein